MIVVDSNIVAYLYLPGGHSAAAEALLTNDPEWVAPILWRSELRNVLATCMRTERLTLEQATAVQNEAEGLLEGAEFEVDSSTVLQLAHDSQCSAYDCEFVALAMMLDCKLATMDKKILRAFPGLAVALSSR